MKPQTTLDRDDFNFEPDADAFRREVVEGLSHEGQKLLPCKYLYDERGSQLFDQICDLPEYYPTRTEVSIMKADAGDMADMLGPRCLLIEYGSGSSIKIRLLLEHLQDPAAYVPLDISREHLMRCAAVIDDDHPDLDVIPVCADYTSDFELPEVKGDIGRKAVYFPGSTLGNFHRPDAVRFLRHIADVVGTGGGLLLGIDLLKDEHTLRAAYNDAQGVTAAFNLNILDRMNRELDTDFDVDGFRHDGRFNPTYSRMEMHLVSQRPQQVTVGDHTFDFAEGETIRTECSYKYTLESFRQLADKGGFDVTKVWTDDNDLFSIQFLTATSA